MPAIRIFVSFDGDHDTDLREELYAQLTRKGSAFEFSEHSRGDSLGDAWTATSRARIRAADEVVVICGEHSDASPRMAAELAIVQEEGVPYMLLWGRRELMCTKPLGAKPADAMYSWTPQILESQLRETLRVSKPTEVPESMKRAPR